MEMPPKQKRRKKSSAINRRTTGQIKGTKVSQTLCLFVLHLYWTGSFEKQNSWVQLCPSSYFCSGRFPCLPPGERQDSYFRARPAGRMERSRLFCLRTVSVCKDIKGQRGLSAISCTPIRHELRLAFYVTSVTFPTIPKALESSIPPGS